MIPLIVKAFYPVVHAGLSHYLIDQTDDFLYGNKSSFDEADCHFKVRDRRLIVSVFTGVYGFFFKTRFRAGTIAAGI